MASPLSFIRKFLCMPYTYLLYDGKKGKLKVGFSSDPDRRVKQTGGRVIMSWRHPFAVEIERKAHKSLRRWHSPNDSGDGRTEWYKPLLVDRAVLSFLIFVVCSVLNIKPDYSIAAAVIFGWWIAEAWLAALFIVVLTWFWGRWVVLVIGGATILQYLLQ
jgi:hypothetical protein